MIAHGHAVAMGADGGAADVGVVVLRAWVEGGQVLRVRITRVVGWEEPTGVVCSSIDGTCRVIRAWLQELLEASGTPGPGAESPP